MAKDVQIIQALDNTRLMNNELKIKHHGLKSLRWQSIHPGKRPG